MAIKYKHWVEYIHIFNDSNKNPEHSSVELQFPATVYDVHKEQPVTSQH